MAQICIKLDDKTKGEVEAVLDEIGLSTSEAIRIYLKQIALKKAIPFRIDLTPARRSDAPSEIHRYVMTLPEDDEN